MKSRLLLCLSAALLVWPATSWAEDAPFFVEATERLGSPQPCDGSGCYSHFVTLADLDGDGDLDAVFANGGGYYAVGTAQPLVVYQNDGKGQFTDVSATAVGGFTGRVRQIAIGDIDGDGDLDLIAPEGYGQQPDAVFINQGGMIFANEAKSRHDITSRAGATRLGDVDDDGDLDLIVTDWGAKPYTSAGTARLYRNDGKGVFAYVPAAFAQDIVVGTGPIDLDLVDIDGDFDLDVLLAMRKGDSVLFTNDGSGQFLFAVQRLPGQPGPYVYGPDACDVDADGDLDLWLDNAQKGLAEQLCINDGEGFFADETAAQVSGNPGADDNEVQCADLDDDGDLDAVIASLSDNERWLVNDGVGNFLLRPNTFPVRGDSTLGMDLGDVDGDGRLDAITAQGEAGDFTNRLYLGTQDQPVDSKPPVFRQVQLLVEPVLEDGLPPATLQPGPLVRHFAVSDRTTTDVGPRLKQATLEWRLGQAEATVVPATFAGGDLFRAAWTLPEVPGGGEVSVRACAVDTGGRSACSAWQNATLVGPAVVEVEPVDTTGADTTPTPPAKTATGGCTAASTPVPGLGVVAGLCLYALVILRVRQRHSRL